MIRTREWKFVHDPMGDRDELYHLAEDPWELINRAGDPMSGTVQDDLQRRLEDWGATAATALPVPLPDYPAGHP